MSMERDLYQIMILSDTYPKVSHYVYLRDFDNSERNLFMYLLEEISQKRAFSVDPPSRFDRGVIVTGGVYRLLHGFLLSFHFLYKMCIQKISRLRRTPLSRGVFTGVYYVTVGIQ